MNINNELKGVLKTLSIDLDDRIIANINMYLDILFSWHEKNNILSTRDPSYFLKRDFFDSLSMLPYLPSGPILDIGTGAGIPGILIAFIRNTEVQLSAMATGCLNPIEPAVMERTRHQFEGGSASANALVRHPEWPALIRFIDKLDSGWKN